MFSYKFGITLGLIAILSQPPASYSQNTEINLEQIWKQGTYRSKGITGIKSMADGKHYTAIVRQGQFTHLFKYNYQTGAATDTLLNGNTLKFKGKTLAVDSYSFNASETKLLLGSQTESIYRHSSKSYYYIYDIKSKEVKALHEGEGEKQSLASFSPQGNQVAFVLNNNLHITDLATSISKALTSDGKAGEIINGAVDWVYEEEFGFDRGFEWSNDGKYIAYYRFNESEVREYSLTYYDSLYPSTYTYKYPKAGEKNAAVDIYIVNTIDGNRSSISASLAGQYEYIPRIKWTPKNGLCFMTLNRQQNELNFELAENKNGTWTNRRIYSEKNETYIEVNDNLLFLDKQDAFFWNSEKDGYNHVYIFNFDGTQLAQLTSGAWDIIDFYGVDSENQKIFFSAALPNPTQKEIYSVSYAKALKSAVSSGKPYIAPSNNSSYLERISPSGGSNSAFFSNTFAYAIIESSTWDSPSTFALYNAAGKKVRDLETNAELREKVKSLKLPAKEFGTFKNAEGDELNYWMIKPANFDPNKTYPAMFFVYGGPGKNTVENRWGGSDFFWHEMLAQKGFVIISVDPRGTLYRGKKFKNSTYKQLGKLETQDMVDAAKHFGALNYIDKERIGIMGWSYGGYLSSLCMTQGAPYFKLGIAVAPVTNWRYYDSIYTERFMQTPEENASGYDNNSPINHVKKLQGEYLLVHGSTDDNVHYQNTMEMINALVAADKQFELFIYPNKNHGIYGGNTRYHLYTKMTNFILEKL